MAFVLCWLPFHVGRTIFSLTHVKTGKTSAHTEIDEIPCGICAKPKVQIDTHATLDAHLADTEAEKHADTDTQSDDASTDEHHANGISHTRGQHLNTGPSTHHLDPSIQTGTHAATQTDTHSDAARVDTRLDTSDANTNRKCCTNAHTHTSMQNTPNHTPPTASTNTYAVTPADLYNDNTHHDTPFNYTYTHPDAHLHHFLYYLSQYFNLASSVLFYLSAAVNPLLYNLMSTRYRHAVHTLIHTRSHTRSHRLHTLTARHSTTTL